jgi:hypothetical protein
LHAAAWTEGSAPQIGLVAMSDGRIVQTFPAPGGTYAIGFARGGRTIWAHAHALTALYDLRPD